MAAKLLSRIKNAKDIRYPWVHFFLYGDTGSGKTTAAATFPMPLLFVPRGENSHLTLKGRDIDYVEVDTPQEFEDALDELLIMKPNDLPCETIVCESMAHYIDLIIKDLTSDGKKPMDKGRWGKLGSHITRLQNKIRNLPVHCVFTSLVKRNTDEEGRVTEGLPMLSGQMAYKLPASCDVIGFCRVEEGANPVYRIHFEHYKVYKARSRFPGFPKRVDNFTFAEIEPHLG